MTQKELDEILELHKIWLNRKGGKQADLSFENLSGTTLNNISLYHIIFKGTNFTNVIFKNVDCSDMNFTDISFAGATFINVYFGNTNFTNVSFEGATFINAHFEGATFKYVDFSGSKGLLNPIDYLNKNFEKTEEGYIVYKTFGKFYNAPDNWKIEPNSIIEEEVDYNRCDECGCGINVATKKWVEEDNILIKRAVWKLLIKWEWLPTVVVPYNTNGKIRCGKAMLLE